MTLRTFHSLCMLTEAMRGVWWEGFESPSDPAYALNHCSVDTRIFTGVGGCYVE